MHILVTAPKVWHVANTVGTKGLSSDVILNPTTYCLQKKKAKNDVGSEPEKSFAFLWLSISGCL